MQHKHLAASCIEGEEEEAISHISSKTFHSSFWGAFVGGGAFKNLAAFLFIPSLVGKSSARTRQRLVMSLADDPRKAFQVEK